METHSDFNEILFHSSASLFTKPDIVFLDLTGACNLSCRYCYRTHLPDSCKRDMDNELYLKIKRYVVPYVKGITLGFLGEPTISAHFRDFISHAIHTGTLLKVFTNGTTMDSDQIEYLKHKPVHVVFSADSVNEKLYKYYRPGGSLKRILRAIAVFARSAWPKAELSMCVDKHNYQELPQMIRFSADHGVRTVYVNYRSVFRPEELTDTLYNEWQNWLEVKQLTEELARSSDIRLILPDTTVCDADYLCQSFFMGIDSAGTVYPCCNGIGAPMGTLCEQDLKEIWASPLYQAFREGITRKEAPQVCKHCSYALTTQSAGNDPLCFFKNYAYLHESFRSMVTAIHKGETGKAGEILSLIEPLLKNNNALRYYKTRIQVDNERS